MDVRVRFVALVILPDPSSSMRALLQQGDYISPPDARVHGGYRKRRRHGQHCTLVLAALCRRSLWLTGTSAPIVQFVDSLSLFLTSNEKKRSRRAADGAAYVPDLLLQGITRVRIPFRLPPILCSAPRSLTPCT
jgi:hypothetical protein